MAVSREMKARHVPRPPRSLKRVRINEKEAIYHNANNRYQEHTRMICINILKQIKCNFVKKIVANLLGKPAAPS
jgi:hypothetical protein